MADDRKDPRGRNLKNGETFDDKTGRYRYSYIDNDGKRKQIYSWTLTKNDRIPAGKKQKSGESLREKIAVVQGNMANGINSSKGNMTVYELMKLHIDLVWNDVKESTRKGYRTNLKFMENNPFGKNYGMYSGNKSANIERIVSFFSATFFISGSVTSVINI